VARFLALDWDQNQLHLVAADVRGSRVTMERAGFWQETSSPGAVDPEELGRLLRDRMKSAGIAPAPLVVSVARDRVILKDLRFPTVESHEEAALVRLQALKELTDSPDEVIIDYVSHTGRDVPEQRATALIIRKDILNGYMRLAQAAGVKLAAVTPRPYGTTAAARRAMAVGSELTPKPEGDEPVAVVTLSDKWAEFCVIRGTRLVLTRTMNLGPGLAGEIRRNLTVYTGQGGGIPVQAVYLSAGAAPELRQRLGEMIEIPIYNYDPFAGAPIDVPGAPGGFAGASGLLFARGEGKLPINFVDPRKVEAPPNPMRSRVLIGACAFVAIVIALVFTGQHILSAREREAEEAEQEKAHKEKLLAGDPDFKAQFDANRKREQDLLKEQDDLKSRVNPDDEMKARLEKIGKDLQRVRDQSYELEKQLIGLRAVNKRLKSIDEWDTVVWLDELYDLTDRIPDVNALRITTLKGDPIKRNPKTPSPFAVRLTVEGELLDPQKGRAPLDEFIAGFNRKADAAKAKGKAGPDKTDSQEGVYYTLEAPPVLKGNKFSFTVQIKRRRPEDYKRDLSAQ
jgi:hypothetical protein